MEKWRGKSLSLEKFAIFEFRHIFLEVKTLFLVMEYCFFNKKEMAIISRILDHIRMPDHKGI